MYLSLLTHQYTSVFCVSNFPSIWSISPSQFFSLNPSLSRPYHEIWLYPIWACSEFWAGNSCDPTAHYSSYSFYLDIFMDFAIYCLGISKILGCYTCPNNDLNFGNNNVLNFGPLIHLIYLTIHLSISLLLSQLILGFCYSLFGHIYVGFGQFSTPHFFSLIYREFMIMSLT